MPPVYVLVKELTEEVRDLLFEWSSELWELRPLFREPGLTREKDSELCYLQQHSFKGSSTVTKYFLNKLKKDKALNAIVTTSANYLTKSGRESQIFKKLNV